MNVESSKVKSKVYDCRLFLTYDDSWRAGILKIAKKRNNKTPFVYTDKLFSNRTSWNEKEEKILKDYCDRGNVSIPDVMNSLKIKGFVKTAAQILTKINYVQRRSDDSQYENHNKWTTAEDEKMLAYVTNLNNNSLSWDWTTI